MKPVFRWGLTVICLAVVGAGSAAWRTAHQGAAAAAAPKVAPVARVTAELARRQVLPETLNALGEVSLGQLASFSFQRAGQVTQLSVLPGDRVAKGAALATLVLDPGARQAYLQAKTAITAARRETDRLKRLLALQLATQSQIDAANKTVLDAKGSLEALDAQGGRRRGWRGQRQARQAPRRSMRRLPASRTSLTPRRNW